jgi:hypothetical protein
MAAEMKTEEVQALRDRLTRAEAIQEKAAAYIEEVQPVADEYQELRSRFSKRAHQIAGVLADRGIIAPTAVNKLVDKLAADQTKALDLVVQIADMVKVSDFGKKADVSIPNGEIKDPFLRLYHFGDPRANTQSSPGCVD